MMKRYQEIAYEIKQSIIEMDLVSGDRLPSISDLAKEFECSKGTVIKAYETLQHQHIVYARSKSGYFVADDLQRINIKNDTIIDLSTGNPTVDSFSILEVKHCLNIAVDNYSNNSLETELRGVNSLIITLQSFLNECGIHSKFGNLFLTQGVMQTLSILSTIEFPNNKLTILIEEPTYSFFVDYLKETHKSVMTISRDSNGLDLEQLEYIFAHENIKFFYTVPRSHNPLGTVLSSKQRNKIVELAKLYDVYIVEDDYFGNAYSLAKYDPLYYQSDFKNVIYLQSYSKIMPYIRIGFAILPDILIAPFWEGIDLSYYSSYHMPSLVSQATLEAAIQNDILQSNMDAVSISLNKKWKKINSLTSTWDQSIAHHTGGESGYYSTIILNPSVDIPLLISNLNEKNIMISSAESSFYNKDSFNNSIRISISRLKEKDLIASFTILYQEICRLVKS